MLDNHAILRPVSADADTHEQEAPAGGEVRLADRAYAGIVELINAEGLAVGDRLPSEAALAERFGMSRTIVREALARLSSDGITEARRGAGSYVKRRPSERLGDHMAMSQLSATLGTYEVRFVLEAEAARLAALRRSPAQMEAIDAALDALRESLLSTRPAHREDWALHRSIALATSNPAFVATYDHLYDEVMPILSAGVDISRQRPPDVIGVMLQEHEMIVDAIRAQDADGAALAMRWHLSQGRKRLMP
jgi:GntR family transcriptional repressor for pyruvate dehydrogenase complex